VNGSYLRGTVNGARVHVLPTDRFKTDSICVYVGYPLRPETVTPTALIPFVLRRGTALNPDMKRLREKLDDLYGAGFGFDLFKRGHYQIALFRADAVRGRFVADSRALLEETAAYVGQLLTQPALERGAFRKDYVESEKSTLRKRIESILNDKTRYAGERCIEELFRGDRYALSPLGRKEDLDAIDASSLYGHYRRWLEEAVVDIYFVGETSFEEASRCVRDYFRWQRTRCGEYAPAASAARRDGEVRRVTETMEVSQGKLHLGYRLPVTYGSRDYPAALLFNGLFGAYPHSKLFMQVREKASLAYYAHSRLDGHIGMMSVQSGIDPRNLERALGIIGEQLEAMKRGDFTDLEWNQTRAMIASQLRETGDSPFQLIAFDFNNVLAGTERTPEGLIGELMRAGREDVMRVAEGVSLDTVYFLHGDGKGEAAS